MSEPPPASLSAYAKLAEPRWYAERGLFVAEGRMVVSRVLDSPRHRVLSLLANPAAHAALASQLARVDQPLNVFVQSPTEIQGLTGHDFHRGCLAIVRRPAELSAAEVLDASRRVLVLDGVSNPDNVGSCFRSAAAFGVDAILLGPTAGDPLYRKAIRTSMASALELRYGRARHDEWPSVLERASRRGLTRIALAPGGETDLETLDAARLARGFALILGAEGPGLEPRVLALADERVGIPMQPGVDSLNVAVAGAVALYRLCRLAASVPG